MPAIAKSNANYFIYDIIKYRYKLTYEMTKCLIHSIVCYLLP